MSTQNNDSYFVRLSRIDVRDFVEKKGQFTYLSWPYAVSQLRQCDPTAKWEVKRFDGLPYLVTDLGVFVEVAVTVPGDKNPRVSHTGLTSRLDSTTLANSGGRKPARGYQTSLDRMSRAH